MNIRFISQKVHAILDYASVAIQSIAPRLLGLERQAGRIHKAALAGTAGYSLLTDYPGGVIKILPMQAHLALDALAGAGFLAAAIVRRRNRPARYTLAAMALLSLASAFCTQVSTPAAKQKPLPPGESPMARYGRQRHSPIAESPAQWPEYLQTTVMTTPPPAEPAPAKT